MKYRITDNKSGRTTTRTKESLEKTTFTNKHGFKKDALVLMLEDMVKGIIKVEEVQ